MIVKNGTLFHCESNDDKNRFGSHYFADKYTIFKSSGWSTIESGTSGECHLKFGSIDSNNCKIACSTIKSKVRTNKTDWLDVKRQVKNVVKIERVRWFTGDDKIKKIAQLFRQCELIRQQTRTGASVTISQPAQVLNASLNARIDRVSQLRRFIIYFALPFCAWLPNQNVFIHIAISFSPFAYWNIIQLSI